MKERGAAEHLLYQREMVNLLRVAIREVLLYLESDNEEPNKKTEFAYRLVERFAEKPRILTMLEAYVREVGHQPSSINEVREAMLRGDVSLETGLSLLNSDMLQQVREYQMNIAKRLDRLEQPLYIDDLTNGKLIDVQPVDPIKDVLK